ncbi:MAG: hypothetical protein GKR95_24805 [Gammaproteobacteria bacterium]|nr:hypothetical protein [Gammaproteobacteria bacterium]NKB65181.1 hypothetical protein [Gammaproteobacteria bacterium]
MRISHDTVIGIVCVVGALCIGFIWIPLDVETGLIEKVRSRKEIGDSFAPAIATTLLFVSGLMMLMDSFKHPPITLLTSSNVKYVFMMIVIGIIAMMLMRWVGPLTVMLPGVFDSSFSGYRPLRDTLPWKYLGYLAGSTFWITILICLSERRFRWRRLVLAFGVSLACAMFYDLPFDDLVLPPNGNV